MRYDFFIHNKYLKSLNMAPILKTLLQSLLTTGKWTLKMQQLSGLFYSCLKFRQFKILAHLGAIVAALAISAGCGAKAPNKKVAKDFYEKEIQLLLIEKQCAVNQPMSAITNDVNALYGSYLKTYPTAFMFLPLKLYDPKNPLILSPQRLRTDFENLKQKMNNKAEASTVIANELFHLYQNTNRFDSVKCAFNTLAQKKANDIRPYLALNDFCQDKNSSPLCSDQSIQQAGPQELKFIEDKTLQLCQSFSKEHNCVSELIMQKKNLKMPGMVKQYQQRFRQERFDKLFSLRNNHMFFKCTEQAGITTLNLKVHRGAWSEEVLSTMLSFVASKWNNEAIKLSFEIVSEKIIADDNVIEITPSIGFTSYVPDNNNRIVYLSDKLDFSSKQKVLAHEFGHVLGFPDCYIEFFDEKEKELIYYEYSNSIVV